MKFIVSSSTLLRQLQHISGVISANTVLPILEDFLFQIDKQVLTITATDLETVMKVSVEVEAKENGRICIPARILLDYLKNNPDQPLTFNINKDSFAVDITSDNGKYKVMGEDPSNFPKEPVADEATSFTLSADALVTAIQKTLPAVSNDDLRPAMTGVCFELGKQLTFVSTDAHRLVKYTRKDVKCPKADSFIVPRKPLNLLKGALPDDESELQLSYSANHLFVTHSHTQLICRLIDARFPDYKVVIPADNPYQLTLNKQDFQNALRRVSVFSNKSTNQVALSITGSELQLSAQDVDFSFEGAERMRCQYTGEDMQIAFNARFLIEMMNAAEGEEVVMELSTPTKAGIIKPVEKEENEELLMLVMPLLLNN
ncbi:DNA polymerase III subunit beta [Compostibacter hankyongensis]|uniref:Beta sliding clamp n=1 Tax=Compostibacter hankyongensis TaxID=1007089 RepID=A0ABP8FCI4_9BACT